MSGFDNGTLQGGIFAQTKQFGSILRGFGPPSPNAGVIGDTYIDAQTFFLYVRRGNNKADPWGNYLFAVPDDYRAGLKWFATIMPTNDIGVDGDYCLLWGGYPNYGLQPSIYGPKAAGTWPTPPVAIAVDLNPIYPAENAHSI